MGTQTSVIKKKTSLREQGIEIACSYLQTKDAEIIEVNTNLCSDGFDIIMKDEKELVFVEVNTKHYNSKGLSEDILTKKKRQYYERLAQDYLFSHDIPSSSIRFDIISVVLNDDQKAFIRHHQDAFSCGQ